MGVNLSKVEKKTKNYSHVLLVMRHAKAEPFNDKGDHDREITDKGEKQAKIVAKGLVGMKLLPDRVACSGAVRARQTLERMLKVFGDHPKVEYRQALYDGGMQSVFDELANAKDKTRVLMVLGHEPTVSVSCQWLASSDSDMVKLDLLNLGMSTASVVVFGSDQPFSRWQVHDAELLAVLSPKDFDSGMTPFCRPVSLANGGSRLVL